MQNLVGQTLNRYQITRLLGEGGMGAVYRANDATLQREVAIKVMHDNFAHQKDFQERFLQEARTAARMNHPGIVQVFDFGQDQGHLYIVMKYIPGDNLEDLLRALRAQNRWMPLSESVELIRQVALALDYAHNHSVLHRDLKPGNIMIEPEPADGLPYRPVLTDLGLAKLAQGGLTTQDSSSMGTPAYMSPEQAMGRSTDPRSDVYSLGIMLFELATGQLPFPARNLSDAIRYHVQTPPPDPHSIRPEIPVELEQVILQAIQKEPAKRYQSASDLAEALKVTLPAAGQVLSSPAGIQASLSLLTQYQNSLIELRGASILGAFPPAPPSASTDDLSQDRIQVLASDQTSRAVVITHPSMTIGRDPECELPLDDPKASRRHARLDFDGQSYRVTDLNSTNGSYLSNARLTPGVAQVWNPEQTLRLGDTYLRLLRAGQPLIPGQGPTLAAETRVAPAETRRTAAGPAAAEATRQSAGLAHAFTSELKPARIKAGQIGQVKIRNLGEAPDSYTLTWQAPSQALDFTPPTLRVNLVPGQEVVVEYRADPRQANWIGGQKVFGFTSQIQPSTGRPQVHTGEVVSSASIPAWVIPLLLVLCLALVGTGLLLSNLVFGRGGGDATQTALVSQTQQAESVQLTNTAGSATAIALEGANLATQKAATATGNAQATGGAATQTAIQVNAQTAVALTASAQQGTFEAGVAQTAQAQQATQQAGLVLTAAVQTAAAQTAIAAQQTQQSQSATLTAQALRRAAYIYSSDSTTANDYRSFLQSQGYAVDLVPMGSIFGTNFAPYKVILIGPETGNAADYQNAPWGDASETQAQYVSASGKPVVGLGRGGSLFFQAMGLFISWGQSWTGTANDIYVVDPAAVYWNFPTSVSVPADQIVKLYDTDSPFLAVYLPGPIAQVATIGRQSNNNDHFPILMESSRFLLWGFDGGPDGMSNKGQRVFLNILWNLAP
jgi:serine/threonine protein kinase